MWKIKSFFVALSIIQISETFDVDQFIKNFCVNNKEMHFKELSKDNFVCENFTFSEQELNDFQLKDFVISDKRIIVFVKSDIGTLNDRFMEKFPNGELFYFSSSKFKLGDSKSQIHLNR